jgi:U11/U12 small nuclear ribonucleoprotein SNRNP31
MNTTTQDTSKSTVYISNLSYERDRNGLKSMFSQFGDIQNIKIIVEPATNQSRGMAFVEMANPSQAMNAIKALDGKNVDGRTVKAKFATPLKKSSVSRIEEKRAEKKKDLSYVKTQLAKKARNEEKRNALPFFLKK